MPISAAKLIEPLVFRSERVLGPRLARLLTERAYLRMFFASREWRNLAFGTFASFQQARDFCAGRGVAARYEMDHGWWADVQRGLKPHDYPAVLWLSRFGARGDAVLDVGGSVGVSYYAYRKVIPDAGTYSWRVLELPEVAAEGRRIAAEQACPQLSFITDWHDAGAPQMLLCAGTAQYLPEHLYTSLARLPSLPRAVVINRVPIHARETLVTLQNTGTSITPCRVYSRAEFVGGFEQAGYRLVDEWQCVQNSLRIPYQPLVRLRHYTGYCFAR